MSKLDIQYDILNDAPATASPVEANFNRIEQHINQEVIERGGTVAMVGQLQLAGNPQASLDAVPKQYVDTFLPIGIISMFGGVAAPPGGKWALCNGAELESALYPELYAIISTTYSAEGTPAGRFNLPNLTDRFPIGQGTVATLGKQGGSRNPLSAHSHAINHIHPYWETEWQNLDHVHEIHLSTGIQSADHTHTAEGGSFLAARGDAVAGLAAGTDQKFVYTHTSGANASHVHAIDGATELENQGHYHGVFTPEHVGRSASEGVADEVTAANLPPHVGVNYIIRIQ